MTTPSTNNEMWTLFHSMWDDAKAQRSYVKSTWMAFQAMLNRRFGALAYNEEGHVCPETNRIARTVRDVIEREMRVGDLTSFVYDEAAKNMGLDPWRMIDGIDPSNDGKTADLWWAHGHSAITVPMDKVIYIQQPKNKPDSVKEVVKRIDEMLFVQPTKVTWAVYTAERTCGKRVLGIEYVLMRNEAHVATIHDEAAAKELAAILDKVNAE